VTTPKIAMDALRSLKAPGTAFDNDILGKDPQPDHMKKFVQLPNTEEGDNGGVHINSGIPNKAFFLVATTIGGNAWEAPGHIWYESLRASNPKTQFQDFADTTVSKAGELFGPRSMQQQAVVSAWDTVGIKAGAVPAKVAGAPASDADAGLAALTKQIAALSAQITALTKQGKTGKAKK
jgi:Zn-dependent metalloprotease